MNKIKAFLIVISILVIGPATKAQDKIEVHLNADLVTQYIWRGMNLGHASIQPTLAAGWKGFYLEAWGSAGISDSEDPYELDLTASYTTGGLSFGIHDYWSGISGDRYFYYNTHGTNHNFEAFVSYDFGVISASWQTTFAGADGKNKNGKRAYTSYFEAIAPFKLATCDWEATVGVVPYATTYYDTNGFAVTNVSLRATKDIKITEKFSVPVFGQIIANPCSQKAYFVFGFTLNAL